MLSVGSYMAESLSESTSLVLSTCKLSSSSAAAPFGVSLAASDDPLTRVVVAELTFRVVFVDAR